MPTDMFGREIVKKSWAHADPKITARREKVTSRWHWLADDILASPAAALIDAGKPWKETFLAPVAAMYGLDRIAPEILDIAGGEGGGRYFEQAAQVAALIPADWIPPAGTSEASAFMDIVHDIDTALGGRAFANASTLFANADGAWIRWRKHLVDRIHLSAVSEDVMEHYRSRLDHEDEPPEEPLPVLYDGLQASYRMSLGFGSQVIVPMFFRDLGHGLQQATANGFDVALEMLMKGGTLEEFIGIYRGAVGGDGAFASKLYDRIGHSDVPTWPRLTADFETGQDVFMAALTSAHDLVDEGRAGINLDGTTGLDNSAACLITDAMAGQVHVFSVRSGTRDAFERLGTVALSYDYGDVDEARYKFKPPGRVHADIRTPWPGIILSAQLVGRGDQEISDVAADRIFRRFAVGIAEGRVALDVKPSAAVIESGVKYMEFLQHKQAVALENINKSNIHGIDDIAKYPVAAKGAIEAAFDAWRDLLPKRLASLSFDEMKEMAASVMEEQLAAGRVRFGI